MDSYNNFSILAWNIRGASSHDTKRQVRDLVRSHKPTLFCVCETYVLFAKVERFWTSLGYKLLFLHEAVGHSGGLWILSCDSNSDYTLIDNMHQAITFQVTRRTDVWYCSFIYASPLFTNRCRLWEYLENLRTQVSGPWLLLGDFNEILYSYEVFGGRFNQSRASLFAQLMHQCHLLDIHCVGVLFTWRKNVYPVGHVRKKLD